MAPVARYAFPDAFGGTLDVEESSQVCWGGSEDDSALADLTGFEVLEHDEARSVFRSPRPSNTLDELESIAVRERLMKETGDYDPGYLFRFEDQPPTFFLDDLMSRPAFPEEGTGYGMATELLEGQHVWRVDVEVEDADEDDADFDMVEIESGL